MWHLKTSNKLCSDKVIEETQRKHLTQLTWAKPTIDNAPPPIPTFLKTRAKQERIKGERLTTMQYQNKILLEKMMVIEKKPTDLHPSQLLKKHFQPTKSLNISKRSKDVHRINNENKAIVNRLQGTRSVYSSKKWKEEEKERNRLRDNISRNGRRFEHKDYTKYGNFPKISGSRMSVSMTPKARITPRDFVF